MEDYPNTFQKGKFITLEGPSGNMWSVAAVERSVLYLGWRAFAHDHRLREGDVLNFNLTKPSHFVVDIFNSNGDVRRSARNARVTGKFSINPAMSALQHHSRKRKEMEMAMPSAADRCKTTAKRGNFNVEYTMGPRLKFCEKTKQWLWHEERDGQELVNLDSDDDEPQGQVNRYERSSKIQRLVEFTIEELEKRKLPEPTPAVTPVVNWAGEVHQVVERSQDDVSGDGEENYVAHNSLDEEKEIPGNPLRQFTTMFDTKLRKTTMDLEAEKPVIDAEMKNVGSEGSLSRQAQITSCDRDTVTMKEEQEGTYLARVVQDVEVDNTLKHTQGTAHVESSVAIALPNSSPQPHKIEDCSNEQGLKAESSNPHIENLNTVSPGNILHSAMEACEKTSSTIQGVSENQNNVASNEVEDPYDINFLEEAAAAYVPVSNKVIVSADSSQLTLPTSTSAMLDVKKQTACEEVMSSHPQRKPEFKECNANISGPEVTPDAAQEKEKSFNIQGKPPTPMVKTDTDTCVLISKRGKVAQVDRERALREAQAWVRTIENPNFMAVMNSSHVYTDFNMVDFQFPHGV